jgi:hypothetical protein
MRAYNIIMVKRRVSCIPATDLIVFWGGGGGSDQASRVLSLPLITVMFG